VHARSLKDLEGGKKWLQGAPNTEYKMGIQIAPLDVLKSQEDLGWCSTGRREKWGKESRKSLIRRDQQQAQQGDNDEASDWGDDDPLWSYNRLIRYHRVGGLAIRMYINSCPRRQQRMREGTSSTEWKLSRWKQRQRK
jgi:hypothetical protein